MPIGGPSTSGETRILFVGDMHLGRSPSRVPQSLGPRDLGSCVLGPRDLGPAAAWSGIVAWAQEHRVHAVALAGDLVQGDNALFEAYGQLQKGVAALIAAGVEVCAVAGNHDTAVLPRLAAVIGDGLHVLGRDSLWTEHLIAPRDGPAVRLVGWSFPAAHHEVSPLLNPPPPPRAGLVTLGLLHGDLNAAASRYAPVGGADLRAVGYQGWFLGHIHQPDPPASDGRPFFLGSISPLDPTETGLHGPVLVRVAQDGTLSAERSALAPLRWERMTLDCPEPGPDGRDLDAALLAAMDARVNHLGPHLGKAKAVGFRIHLQGQAVSPVAVARAVDRINQQENIVDRADVVYFLENVTSAVAGRQDLRALAALADPVGLLARKILALTDPEGPVPGVEDPAGLAEALLRDAQARAAQLAREPNFSLLEPATPPARLEHVRRLLIQAGRLALDHLLTGKEGGRAAH